MIYVRSRHAVVCIADRFRDGFDKHLPLVERRKVQQGARTVERLEAQARTPFRLAVERWDTLKGGFWQAHRILP